MCLLRAASILYRQRKGGVGRGGKTRHPIKSTKSIIIIIHCPTSRRKRGFFLVCLHYYPCVVFVLLQNVPTSCSGHYITIIRWRWREICHVLLLLLLLFLLPILILRVYGTYVYCKYVQWAVDTCCSYFGGGLHSLFLSLSSEYYFPRLFFFTHDVMRGLRYGRREWPLLFLLRLNYRVASSSSSSLFSIVLFPFSFRPLFTLFLK